MGNEKKQGLVKEIQEMNLKIQQKMDKLDEINTEVKTNEIKKCALKIDNCLNSQIEKARCKMMKTLMKNIKAFEVTERRKLEEGNK